MKCIKMYQCSSVRTVPIICLAFTAFILLANHSSLAQVRTSTNYEVTEEVVVTGGHVAASINYINESTLGQPGTVGIHTSIYYENQNGFWHTILVELPIPTISTIGLILLVMGFSVFIFRKISQECVV